MIAFTGNKYLDIEIINYIPWSKFVFLWNDNNYVKELCLSDNLWLDRLFQIDPELIKHKPNEMTIQKFCIKIEEMFYSLKIKGFFSFEDFFEEAIYRKPFLINYWLNKGAIPTRDHFDNMVQTGNLEMVKVFYEKLKENIGEPFDHKYNYNLMIKEASIAQFLMEKGLFIPDKEYIYNVAFYNKSYSILDWSLSLKISPDEDFLINVMKKRDCDKTQKWIIDHLDLFQSKDELIKIIIDKNKNDPEVLNQLKAFLK